MTRVMSYLVVAALLLMSVPVEAATFKIATVAPEGSDWMQQMRAGAIKINSLTAGRVTFKFYGGGVMGNEKSVLRKIRMGQLQGGAFTGGGLGRISSDVLIYGLPLLTSSEQEMGYLREHLDQDIAEALYRSGFVSFGLASGGFANLMSQTPIRCIDDLKGKKVWVPEGDRISYGVMEALGLAPVTLPLSDVLTGLQTGLVEVIGTSPLGALAFQWHTRVHYVTPMPLVYIYGALVIDKKRFEKISAADQTVVTTVLKEMYRGFDRQNVLDNEDAMQALLKQGVQLVQSKPGEYQRWNSVASATIEKMVGKGLVSEKLYTKTTQLLNAYRRKEQLQE